MAPYLLCANLHIYVKIFNGAVLKPALVAVVTSDGSDVGQVRQ